MTEERWISAEEIAGELHALARARSVAAFVLSRHSALAQVALSLDNTDDEGPLSHIEAVRLAIAAAIRRIPDERHRRAAEAIFEFGVLNSTYGKLPLSQRQYQAADAFGVGYDTYRRRGRQTGMSLYDETIVELALALKNLPGRVPIPAAREHSPLKAEQIIVEASKPESDGSRTLVLRMPEKAYAELERLAEALHVPEPEVVRRALLLARALFHEGDKRVLLVDDEGRSKEVVLLW